MTRERSLAKSILRCQMPNVPNLPRWFILALLTLLVVGFQQYQIYTLRVRLDAMRKEIDSAYARNAAEYFEQWKRQHVMPTPREGLR
jgi:hypothetical protein